MQQVTSRSTEQLQPLLTIPQVARLLGVSRPTVYELIYKKGLPFVKLNKCMRVVPSSLQRWLIEQEQPAQEGR